jgi:hypothetical protein
VQDKSECEPDPFSLEAFLPYVGDVFHVVVNEGLRVPVLLSEIAALSGVGVGEQPRQPFSLVFHATRDAPLTQQMYRVEHPALEPFDSFLVLIGPDAVGMRLEAIYT